MLHFLVHHFQAKLFQNNTGLYVFLPCGRLGPWGSPKSPLQVLFSPSERVVWWYHNKHVASNSYALNLFRDRYSWKAGRIRRTIFTHFFTCCLWFSHLQPVDGFFGVTLCRSQSYSYLNKNYAKYMSLLFNWVWIQNNGVESNKMSREGRGSLL